MNTMREIAAAALPLILVLSAGSALSQNIVHVNVAADSAGDGTSWERAFRHLQDALAAAEDGDEVWVAQGIYYADVGSGIERGDRRASFRLKSGVGLYGGFQGTEARREERDWELYRSILSGDLLQNDDAEFDPESPTRSDNSYHVVMSAEEGDSLAVLDGFVIQDGQGDGEADSHGSHQGGGMHLTNSHTRVSNSTFRANAARLGGAMVIVGGAPLVSNVIFEGNAAIGGDVGGGALFTSSRARLVDVSFIGNLARRSGGAIEEFGSPGGGSITVINAVFIGNSTYDEWGPSYVGGGAVFTQVSNPTYVNAKFFGNTSFWSGGAVSTLRSEPTSSTACSRGT